VTPFFSFLSRNAAWVLAAGVFTGLLIPGTASLVRPLLPATVGGLLVLAVMQMNYGEFGRYLSRPLMPAVIVVGVLCVLPVLTWALVTALGVPQDLRTPIVLMSAAPSIMSAPAMALILRLSVPLMLSIVVGSTLLAPFTLGLAAKRFVEADLLIDPLDLALRLALFICVCFAVASLLRRTLGTKRIESHKTVLEVIGLLLLLTFAVAIMDGVADRLADNPRHVIIVLAVSFVANLLLQGAGGAAFYSAGARDALTIAFACGNRNMGLLLAVLPESSPPDTLLYFAVAQVPIYTLPAILSPMYNALLERPS
jgi:BASS family bile acid:Na+ symporter